MEIALIYTTLALLTIALIFTIIGYTIAKLVKIQITEFYEYQLFGFAFISMLASIACRFSINIDIFIFALIILATICLVSQTEIFLRIKSFKIVKYIDSKTVWVATFITFGYMLLMNNKLTETIISYRKGPDVFGWVGTANYLARGGNLGELTKSVSNQLGSTSLLDPLYQQHTYHLNIFLLRKYPHLLIKYPQNS